MRKKSVAIPHTSALRRQAETQLSARRQQTPVPPVTEVEALRLVHELEVHQIELEMQNEELLRSRADLEAALEQYDDLYDFAPVGYFTLTETGAIQRVNLTGARLLGQERSKLVKRRLGLFVDFEQRPAFSAFLTQVFATSGEQHTTCEVLLAQADAAPSWVQLEGVGSVGKPVCKVIVMDITARKIAENALRASEKDLQSFLNNAPDTIYVMDLVTHSSQFLNRDEFLGYSKQELESRQSIMAAVHPDDLAAIGAHWQDVTTIGTEQTVDIQYRIYNKTGGLEWLQQRTTVLARAPEGKPQKLLITLSIITGRKWAENKLKESERKLREANADLNQAQSVAKIGNWKWNLKTGVVEWSDGMYRIFGIDKDSYTGRLGAVIAKVIHPDDLHVVLPSNADAFAKNEPQEYRIIRPTDSSIRHIWAKAGETILDEQGNPIFLTGIAQDITSRKQAEEALRESEEKYRGLMESLDSVVATVDFDGKFLYMNDMAAEQLGGTAADLTGRSMHELFPEELATRQLKNIRAVIKEDQGQVFEELSLVGGQPRWYRTSIQPIHAENGQVTHVLLNSHDINDLKVAQQELQELNRTLEIRVQQRTAEVQDLYDNAPAGYHSLDTDGNLIMINQTELNWLGYTRNEVVGRPYSNFYAPANLEVFKEQFLAFKKRGWVKDLEVELLNKDQRVIPVVINSTAMYDANGNFVMSRSTVIDNTERKAATEALRRANLELEHALRMKDEFLANMSHELRTPLNGILGLSEILLEGYRGALNENQRKFVHNINLSGRHLLSLINDLLDVSKIEAGQLGIQPETVLVEEICLASLAFVKELAEKKNISLEFLPEAAAPTLLADERRLKQILINLLSNAVKFTPANGSVILKVLANPAQKCLEFSISDTGIGISAADLQRLFSPFTQVDGGLARQYEGTGLGLALVKRLTELHGGTVTVTSVVGQGSCFTVALPWEPVPKVQPILPACETLTVEKSQNNRSQGAVTAVALGTILLAEDNETNQMMIGDFLESLGYQMLAANNGLEALNLAVEKRPDLIVMDIQMPGMDGLETIRYLRTDSRFTNLPIIALTALAMPGDRERCLAAGADAYLSKPVSLNELAERVKELTPKAPP